MAFVIMAKVGEENPKAVIATTITAYAISSVVTGLAFFIMGITGCGYLVGFIPRHILTGCIGGVGFFLVATGIEVTARLDGNLEYNLDTLRRLFQSDTLALWIIPFALALILFQGQQIYKSRYFTPGYILTIPAIFYFFVFSLDELDLGSLTSKGWIFQGPESGEPWWFFYTLYGMIYPFIIYLLFVFWEKLTGIDFKLVDWEAIAETIPSMLSLTFFGILHVPINVPSLGFSVKEDDISLDRELIAHGISNTLSGFVGSIQNYLVYANSVMFYKSGGNSRLAGIMLAAGTIGVMLIGPSLIGFIPVMMVGCLIFLLGFELMVEALWATRKALNWLEFCTVGSPH